MTSEFIRGLIHKSRVRRIRGPNIKPISRLPERADSITLEANIIDPGDFATR
jgi:hypothetical protein